MSRRHPNGHHSPSPDNPLYNDTHRALVQAFFSHSLFTLDDLKPVVAAILTASAPDRPTHAQDITPLLLTPLLQTTNAALTPLDYQIRSARDQHTGTPIYALVNTTSDLFTQPATSLSSDEIAYVKRLLDAMFDAGVTRTREVMAVREMVATQLAKVPRSSRQSQAAADIDAGEDEEQQTQAQAQAKSLTHDDAERVLALLLTQGYLRRSRAHYYSLAPRGLLELRTYLKETYNEPGGGDDDDEPPVIRIRDCEGCREIVTVGLRCDDRACGVRWHERCAAQFFGGQEGRQAKKCPRCKGAWTASVFVGEKADRVQGRSSRSMVEDLRGEEEEDDDEE